MFGSILDLLQPLEDYNNFNMRHVVIPVMAKHVLMTNLKEFTKQIEFIENEAIPVLSSMYAQTQTDVDDADRIIKNCKETETILMNEMYNTICDGIEICIGKLSDGNKDRICFIMGDNSFVYPYKTYTPGMIVETYMHYIFAEVLKRIASELLEQERSETNNYVAAKTILYFIQLGFLIRLHNLDD